MSASNLFGVIGAIVGLITAVVLLGNVVFHAGKTQGVVVTQQGSAKEDLAELQKDVKEILAQIAGLEARVHNIAQGLLKRGFVLRDERLLNDDQGNMA